MRALSFFRWSAVVLLSTDALAQSQGQPNSFCLFDNPPGDDQINPNVIFLVDDDVNEDINAGMSLSPLALDNADVENFVDQQLQNLARHARHRIRGRVVRGEGDCSVYDGDETPCVQSLGGSDDACQTANAWAACFPTSVPNGPNVGCAMVLCQGQFAANQWESGRISETVAHEFGHIFGLQHVADNVSPAGNCNQYNSSFNGCESTSDGCGGEVMCNLRGCRQSMFATDGDMEGLAARYGTHNRKVFYGADPLDTNGIDTPGRTESDLGHNATYAPRIACARNGVNETPHTRCAAVLSNREFNNYKIIRLNGTSTNGNWSTQSLRAELTSVEASMPADISLSDDGETAMITRVSDSGNLRTTRVMMTDGSTATIDLSTNANQDTVLAPRIAYGRGYFWVLHVTDQELGSENFGIPLWDLKRIGASSNTVTDYSFASGGGGIPDLDGGDTAIHAPVSDYDFDCKPGSAFELDCTIVAQIHHIDSNVLISRMRSIHFTVSIQNTVATVTSAWTYTSNEGNGVLGVTYGPGDDMFVSHSRPITGPTADNTRITWFPDEEVDSTPTESVTHGSDAESCSASTMHGFAIGNQTHHGGYSIAWCRGCGGTNGVLQSVTWGRRWDDDAFCF